MSANKTCKTCKLSTQEQNLLQNSILEICKGKNKKRLKYHLVCKEQSPEINCNATHVGEVGRWFLQHVEDHHRRGKKSRLVKHTRKIGHEYVNLDNFEILSSGYRNNRFKGRHPEALHINHVKPIFNVQEQSVPLKLLNGSR